MAEGRPDSHPDGRRGLQADSATPSPGALPTSRTAWTPAWKPRKRRTTSSPACRPSSRRSAPARFVCRVYRKEKFHAKAYITHARLEVVGSSALVGSSNFTYPGLTENIELNVQITGRPVTVLQEWYEEHWDNAEDVTPEILQVIERQTREYTPFEVYAKALHESVPPTRDRRDQDWLDHQLARLSRPRSVPEGRLPSPARNRQPPRRRLPLRRRRPGQDVHRPDAHRVPHREEAQTRRAVRPKVRPRSGLGARDSRSTCPQLAGGHFSSLAVFNHTDLQRGGEFPEYMRRMRQMADVVLIDEAHHFRNPGYLGTDRGIPSSASGRRPATSSCST